MAKKRAVRKRAEGIQSAPQEQSKQKKQKTIRFDYIKSNCFRVIHVDGVHGGPTPRVDGVQMAFFSERAAIPTREEHVLTEKSTLGKRIRIEKRDAIVREVEVEAILSIEMAKRLEEWIHEKVEQIKKLRVKGANNG